MAYVRAAKPIHILVGISPDAVITGVRLVKHSEPIVLVGIPEAKIKAVTEQYAGLDLKSEASGETEHDVDIVSGATVTVMVIDDSIIRAGIKAARAQGLPGFAAAAPEGPGNLHGMDRDHLHHRAGVRAGGDDVGA